MTNLYSKLASVYEAMYYSFIDYEEEYIFYSNVLKKYNKNSVLEIGSGTGNLAPHFLKNGFEYLGLDYSKDMTEIAKEKVPEGKFIVGDMRDFQLESQMQSAIITGRTISYIVEYQDVRDTFASVRRNLESGGILCFDFIDANRFILDITKERNVVHQATHKGKTYQRRSTWDLKGEYSMDVIWDSTYYEKTNSDWQEIGKDHAQVRTYMLNEIEIFLALEGFEIREVIDRPTYAFPTYVIVAEVSD